jgi:hypothetical protein
MPADVLYRWRIEASGPDPVARMREVVNLAVGPAVASPQCGGAQSYYVSKHTDDPPPTRHTVWLTFVAPPTAEAVLRTAVDRQLAGVTVLDYCVTTGDPVLRPEHAWWRRGVRRVTDVALDLHRGSDAEFLAHRNFLVHIAGRLQVFANPQPVLRDYLSQRSQPFRTICATLGGEDEFWRDFFTWPSEPVLSYPGHWLFNIMHVLG